MLPRVIVVHLLLVTYFLPLSQSKQRLLFGSCNRQSQQQSFWSSLQALRPSVFLWLGDAVYAKDNSIAKLEDAYNKLLHNESYQNFARETFVAGTWDDHDYGVNDGGNLVAFRDERKKLFSSFLYHSNHIEESEDVKLESCDAPSGSINKRVKGPKISVNAPSLTSENADIGVYSSLEVGMSPTKIKIILLDTRFHRESHWIRSIGEIKWLPLSALVAAAIRAFTTFLNIGGSRQHTGDMLGESQWEWLGNELRNSDANFHIIASSVQVFTSNPVVESWGHFPESKKRLVDLLESIQPSGLVFLSGDVHHGEVSHPFRSQASSSSDLRDWVEVTSSGLTHTCADSWITRLACPRMLSLYSEHREKPARESRRRYNRTSRTFGEVGEDGYFIGRNVGSIETFEGNKDSDFMPYMQVSLHRLDRLGSLDAEESFQSSVVFSQRIYSSSSPRSAQRAQGGGGMEYPEFPCVWEHLPSSWQEVLQWLCTLRGVACVGVCCCVYFQFKCFLLIRSEIKHLMSHFSTDRRDDYQNFKDSTHFD